MYKSRVIFLDQFLGSKRSTYTRVNTVAIFGTSSKVSLLVQNKGLGTYFLWNKSKFLSFPNNMEESVDFRQKQISLSDTVAIG